MKFDLVLLPQADRDVDLIVNFLHSKSPRGADAWYGQWLRACDTLKQSADSFGVAPENDDNDFTVQQFIFKTRYGNPYRVIYRIVDRTAYVYHVRGPGQDYVTDLGHLQLPDAGDDN